MKDYQGMKIIGIDNGYGNIKTANCCFPAGLTAHDAEPVFKDELLVYGGRYYLIGTGHKEFAADKTGDDDYYVLTLAAIARELNAYGLTAARVRLAVGLPLTWVSQQREDFKAYLLRSWEVSFTFRGKAYQAEIAGADVFPQGFAAVASQIRDFQGVNMLCDIGNGTMNIMFINDRKPAADRMFTEKYGTHHVCWLSGRTSCEPTTPRWTTPSSRSRLTTPVKSLRAAPAMAPALTCRVRWNTPARTTPYIRSFPARPTAL